MVTFNTNCDTFVSGVSVVNGGMRVDVAVRGDRGHKHALSKREPGKQLPLSQRSAAPAGSPPTTLPATIPSTRTTWRSIERSSSRRYLMPALELPAAAWAALVLARA